MAEEEVGVLAGISLVEDLAWMTARGRRGYGSVIPNPNCSFGEAGNPTLWFQLQMASQSLFSLTFLPTVRKS